MVCIYHPLYVNVISKLLIFFPISKFGLSVKIMKFIQGPPFSPFGSRELFLKNLTILYLGIAVIVIDMWPTLFEQILSTRS